MDPSYVPPPGFEYYTRRGCSGYADFKQPWKLRDLERNGCRRVVIMAGIAEPDNNKAQLLQNAGLLHEITVILSDC